MHSGDAILTDDPMSRIRWYHFFFVLSLFDVAVILSSL